MTEQLARGKGISIFISYSHADDEIIQRLVRHFDTISSSIDAGFWIDVFNKPGDRLHDEIDENVRKCKIFIACLSLDYLQSRACQEELEIAIGREEAELVKIIPVIVQPCGWLSDGRLSNRLAVPKDGKAIVLFENRDQVLLDVIECMRGAVNEISQIMEHQFSSNHAKFLEDAELFSRSPSSPSTVLLSDIYAPPMLEKLSDEDIEEDAIPCDSSISELIRVRKSIVSGYGQSGRTSLCKEYIKSIRDIDLIPVYLSPKQNGLRGKINNILQRAYADQYQSTVVFDKVKGRIVVVVDDFHKVANQENLLNDLSDYKRVLLTSDQISGIDLRVERLLVDYTKYKIKEYLPSMRNALIEKWIKSSGREVGIDLNAHLGEIDRTTDVVNGILGRAIGKGIVPSFPFFILMILQVHESQSRPIHHEITSQGHCYQALIYLYLRNNNVKNDDIDTYMNVLTELAFSFFIGDKKYLSPDELGSFFDNYQSRFNLPVDQERLVLTLANSGIINRDGFGAYRFGYPYVYYFFASKYLSEHSGQNDIKVMIEKILGGLDDEENAYIAIFFSHHSRNNIMLDELMLNAQCLFEEYDPATLDRDQVRFFDDAINHIFEAKFPKGSGNPLVSRSQRLRLQDERESAFSDSDIASQENGSEGDDDNEDIESAGAKYHQLVKDIRRSIKTVEVMGVIIKSRAGSLERSRLKDLFRDAMHVHLRILGKFFEMIRDPESQEVLIEFITSLIGFNGAEAKKENPNLSEDEVREIGKLIAKKAFWNINFDTVRSYIRLIIHSLGSDQLMAITNEVCDEESTPASFLVKHGISMWYKKYIDINECRKAIKNDGFSKIATLAFQYMLVDHSTLHSVGHEDLQRIEAFFGVKMDGIIRRRLRVDRQQG